MRSPQPVSLELEPELNEKVAAVAEMLDRPEAWVIEQAIKEFVEFHAWQLAAIEQGIADADAGRMVRHDDVVAWVESWGRADELPMPECK